MRRYARSGGERKLISPVLPPKGIEINKRKADLVFVCWLGEGEQ
jgi:hypothetical protein